MKDLLLDFFQTLLALQGVTSQSVNEMKWWSIVLNNKYIHKYDDQIEQ